MMVNDNEKNLCERIKRELDARTERLDGASLRHLKEARERATMAGIGRGRCHFAFFPSVPRWLTAGGIAATAAVVTAVSFWLVTPRKTIVVKHAEDLEIMTTQEHLELYSDLEFYRWLANDEESR
ncbi:MAG TPA: hypothetical protein VI389_03635 [Geobacteraceae bacterium]